MRMKNEFKVAIATKGRYGFTGAKSKTTGLPVYAARMIGSIYDHALNNDIEELNQCYIFVEPQEADQYAETYPEWPKTNIIVLGGNDQGISFARQTVLEFFQKTEPTDIVFTLDDDLTLGEYQWGPHPKTGELMYLQVMRDDVLNLLDEFISFNKALPEWEKVGIASFDYNQYGWTNVKKFPPDGSLDTCTDPKAVCSNHAHSDCAVMLRPLIYKKHNIIYDCQAPLKEDRDINAQVQYHGYYGRLIFKYLMISPLNSTNKGGCSTFYHTEGYCDKSIDYLLEKWNKCYPKAELVQDQKKNTSYGRTRDIRFWWRRFYHARVNNLIKVEIETPYLYPDIINNAHRYSENA